MGGRWLHAGQGWRTGRHRPPPQKTAKLRQEGRTVCTFGCCSPPPGSRSPPHQLPPRCTTACGRLAGSGGSFTLAASLPHSVYAPDECFINTSGWGWGEAEVGVGVSLSGAGPPPHHTDPTQQLVSFIGAGGPCQASLMLTKRSLQGRGGRHKGQGSRRTLAPQGFSSCASVALRLPTSW